MGCDAVASVFVVEIMVEAITAADKTAVAPLLIFKPCILSHLTASPLPSLCLPLQAYRECLGNIMLSGPTLFGPLIKATHDIAVSKNFT
jgi:hypothetical protein